MHAICACILVSDAEWNWSQSPQQGTQDVESISNEDLRRTSEHFPLDQSGTLAVTLESLPRRYFESFDCCCFRSCTCTQYTQSNCPCLFCNMCEGIQTIPTSMCRPVNRLYLRSCQLACANLLLEYQHGHRSPQHFWHFSPDKLTTSPN